MIGVFSKHLRLLFDLEDIGKVSLNKTKKHVFLCQKSVSFPTFILKETDFISEKK